MTPLAITGLGIVSTLGVGKDAWHSAWSNPKQAFETAHRSGSDVLDTARFAQAHTCEVWGWEPGRWLGEKGHRHFDRLTTFLSVAASLALQDSGVKAEDGGWARHSPQHVGVASATAYGSLDSIAELVRVSELEDPRYINPTRFPNTVINSAAGYVSIREQLKGPNTTIVSGNCGALDAVLNAHTHLMNRRCDAMLVGGGEVVSESLYIALEKLGLLGHAGAGITVGEGACFLLVERAADAKRSGQKVLGRITGYGSAFAAPSSDALLAQGSEVAVTQAMQAALQDAQVQARDIDLICLAAGGVEEFDRPEAAAVNQMFGSEIACVAPKQILGESFGVAGGFAIAASLAWLNSVPLPPLTTGVSRNSIRRVLVNAIGYYGNASSVVLEAPVL